MATIFSGGMSICSEGCRAHEQVILCADVVREAKDLNQVTRFLEQSLEVATIEIGYLSNDVVRDFRLCGQFERQLLDAAIERRVLEHRGTCRGDRKVLRPRFDLLANR